MFWNTPVSPALFFSRANIDNTVFWGPIIEKAWAKVIGSYAAYVGDLDDIATGIRALSGVPVMKYSSND